MAVPDSRIEIGARLRAARRDRGLTIDDLARASGLTKGFLSQVERDLASTSVSSLLKICAALGIRIGDLFEEDGDTGLVRAGEQPSVHFGGVGAQDRLLTPRSNRRLQIFHSTVAPGARSDADSYPTPTDAQFVHVTKGEFELTIAGEAFRLKAGDSLTFSGREPRSWRNPSRSRGAELIWVITPSLF